jgi:hypothetical protein
VSLPFTAVIAGISRKYLPLGGRENNFSDSLEEIFAYDYKPAQLRIIDLY